MCSNSQILSSPSCFLKAVQYFSELNSSLDNRVKISQIETEKNICQRDINNFNDSLEIDDGVCPTCLRDIDDDCRDHLEQESLDAVKRYHDFEDEIRTIKRSQKQYKILLDQIIAKQNQQKKQFTDSKTHLQGEDKQQKRDIQEKLNAALEKIYQLAEQEGLEIERDYDKYIENLKIKLAELQAKKEVVSDTAKKIKEIETAIKNIQQRMSATELQLAMVEEEDRILKSQTDEIILRDFNVKWRHFAKLLRVEDGKEET